MNESTAIDPHTANDPSPARCENCGTALQGHYCHTCGQSVHSPVRSFAHALEEVFESFWHLDGRIFRTLRDLWIPGRVANNYLAGQRVKYVQPLRLFVILSLLAVFVAHFAFSFEGSTIKFDNDERARISDAKTVEEVVRLRDEALRELQNAKPEAAKTSLGGAALAAGIEQVQRLADRRIRELQQTGAAPAGVSTQGVDATLADPKTSDAASKSGPRILVGDEDWDPRTDPVTIPGLPDFANAWLTRQTKRAVANAERANADREAYKDAALRAVPSTLFVLLPFFALLLKILYFFTRRMYLEHLVVALYSHAWLLLALLAIFLSMILRNTWPGQAWVGAICGVFEGLVWAWIPIYLFWMQKRVYGQSWWLTLLKYLVLGNVYVTLLSLAIAASFVIGLVRM